MAETKPKSQPERIVDVDVHLMDTADALAPFCELPWRLSLEAMGKLPYRHFDTPGLAASLRIDPPMPGGHPKMVVKDKVQMRTELNDLGITDAFLLPDNLLAFGPISNIDYAAAVMRAYNRWLCAEWLEEGSGLWGAMMVAPQDPDAAAAEIEAYADNPQIKAIFLPTAGLNPLWGNRKYEPIMRAANDTKLPLILHSVTLISPAFPNNTEQFENHFSRQIITHPFSMMANMTGLMDTGVLPRYPDLKVIFTEAGISWVPHMMWRMDRYWQEYRRQVAFFEEAPSEYMKRQMWFATQPLEEPENPAHLVEQINHCGGADRIMFASDWPHHDFDHPRALAKLPLKPDERKKIMFENAVEVFDLPPLSAKQMQMGVA